MKADYLFIIFKGQLFEQSPDPTCLMNGLVGAVFNRDKKATKEELDLFAYGIQ